MLVHPDPLRGLQALAHAWRRELGARGAQVVAITGSTGKTSTKDILAAVLGAQRRTAASSENLNTEIGLPLSLLAAPGDTEMLVLEMAMRGPGQIAELTEIAEPDVGVIVNVGPVHLELLGSIEAIAAAKAELIAGIASGATVVVPAGEPLLRAAPARGRAHAHVRRGRRRQWRSWTARGGGAGRGRAWRSRGAGIASGEVVIRHEAQRMTLRPSFAQRHNLANLLAAVAAARALGVTPEGELRGALLGAARRADRAARGDRPGQRLLQRQPDVDARRDRGPDGNRLSASTRHAGLEPAPGSARRLAVLGDMLELGREAGPALHREVGAYASARGVEVLVTVGPLAAEMAAAFAGEAHSVPDAEAAGELLEGLLRDGDTVLVKGSRGVGLERVAQILQAGGAAQTAGRR